MKLQNIFTLGHPAPFQWAQKSCQKLYFVPSSFKNTFDRVKLIGVQHADHTGVSSLVALLIHPLYLLVIEAVPSVTTIVSLPSKSVL